MNITFYTNTDLTDRRSLAPLNEKPAVTAGRETGNYDKLTINRSPAFSDETSFAKVLAREVNSRLDSSVSPERVRTLHQQVVSGTYQPDSKRIAEHMLGYR